MRYIDLHCDVLYALWKNPSKSFYTPTDLRINAYEMEKFQQMIQVMALYVPEMIPHNQRMSVVLEMLEIFHHKILQQGNGKYKWIRNKEDWLSLQPNEKGFLLSLEGCEAISDDYACFEQLIQAGVRIFGLTWNYANLFGDGVLEERGAGLTRQGKRFLQRAAHAKVQIDVSHLNEAGFWDCVIADASIIATHSNAKKICNHPRNLTDAQIQALIQKDGLMGLTFVPQFLSVYPCMEDIIRHIDHVCALGGENILAFGSDFEGFDGGLKNLHQLGQLPNLLDCLSKYFSDELIDKICYRNAKEKLEMD